MRLGTAAAILCSLFLFANSWGCATPGSADDAEMEDSLDAEESAFPDLTGIWLADVRAIYTGVEGPHAYEVVRGGVNIGSLPFKVSIDLQDGGLFNGTIKSTGEAEPFLGAIRSDGALAVFTTVRGGGTFTILDANRMESCYTHGTELTMFASCVHLLRLTPAP